MKKRTMNQRSDVEWDEAAKTAEMAPVDRRLGLVGQLIVAGFLLAGIAVIVSLFLSFTAQNSLGQQKKPHREQVVQSPQRPSESSEIEGVAEEEIVLWFDRGEVKNLCRDFLKAGNVENILSLVRDSEVLDSKIREYYAKHPPELHALHSVQIVSVVQERVRKAVYMSVTTSDYQTFPMFIVGTEEGPKVDWESWVGYGDLPWDEFLREKTAKPVLMRVMLSKVDYYNMDFMDEAQWLSMRIRSSDDEHTMYAYVSRDSALAARISSMMASMKTEETRAIVRIRFPEGASSRNQVLMDELVVLDWLLFDSTP